MSQQEQFENEMEDVCEKLDMNLQKQDDLKNEEQELRVEIENILSRYNRDVFDNGISPLVVTFKMVKQQERMVKGGKDLIRSMLTEDQFRSVYPETEGEKPQLRVMRRDRMRSNVGD